MNSLKSKNEPETSVLSNKKADKDKKDNSGKIQGHDFFNLMIDCGFIKQAKDKKISNYDNKEEKPKPWAICSNEVRLQNSSDEDSEY